MSLAELERKANLKPRTIYKWDDNTPSADKVYAVANVLDTTVDELIKEDGRQKRGENQSA